MNGAEQRRQQLWDGIADLAGDLTKLRKRTRTPAGETNAKLLRRKLVDYAAILTALLRDAQSLEGEPEDESQSSAAAHKAPRNGRDGGSAYGEDDREPASTSPRGSVGQSPEDDIPF